MSLENEANAPGNPTSFQPTMSTLPPYSGSEKNPSMVASSRAWKNTSDGKGEKSGLPACRS
ncbi:hypothetical protein D3C72_2430490 [compost metagenome]